MKIKLAVSKEHYDEIKAALLERGIEIDDTADLVLSEHNQYVDNLMVRDMNTNERIFLPVDDVVSIEAYGRTIEVHTRNSTYQVMDRLYKIASLLDPERFLRISNSVIVAKEKIKRITPTLSMKFVLTLVDGRKVDVTRSYYYIFKENFDV